MKDIEIRRMEGLQGLKEFVQFRYDLYRDCQWAVPFLFSEEMNTLRSDKNAAFECCEADYFMAYRDGKAVGRVAAIINRRANERWQCKQVRFGWLDFIDDSEVSRALLDKVEAWGRERGMTEMIGPMGFTDMDREGMLIEGFEEDATMYINYNYSYYPQHMEQMGDFEKDNDYMECKVKVPEQVPDKFHKIAAMIGKRYNLQVRKFNRKELLEEGKGHEIFNIINTTYKDLYGYSELSDRQINQLVDEYIKIADLNLVSVVVDTTQNDKMVGFGITFPSLSEAMKKTRDGRLFPFGWYHLLNAIYRHRSDTVDMLLLGVLPEYRAKGANAMVFCDLVSQYIRYGFKWAQAMQQMETNSNVLSNWNYFDSYIHRRLRCYKKQLR